MLNKVMFVGYIGRDPELKHAASGAAICNFSVASSERWKGKDGDQQEHTEWLRCSAFDRLAEVCGEYLKKGSLVYVEGSLKTREYTDKEGVKKFSTECRLQSMKMLGGKAEGAPAAAPAPAPAAPARPAPKPATAFDDMDDDIPF